MVLFASAASTVAFTVFFAVTVLLALLGAVLLFGAFLVFCAFSALFHVLFHFTPPFPVLLVSTALFFVLSCFLPFIFLA